MSNARIFTQTRAALIFFAAALIGSVQVYAQGPSWSDSTPGMYPMVASQSHGTPLAANAYGQPANPMPPGPRARLVINPDPSSGLPPFALADQAGTIQRYVEPVPGIDLRPYVDQVVIVRHDTGRTLLASQLELPPQPLYPMMGGAPVALANHAGLPFGSMVAAANARQLQQHSAQGVQRAQYVDNDDATVQLVPEGEVLPDGSGTQFAPGAAPYHRGFIEHHPGFSGEMPPMGMGAQGFAPMPCDPMSCGPMGCDVNHCGPGAMEPHAAGMYGMQPCPQCGRYHAAPGRDPRGNFDELSLRQNESRRSRVYGDVEINFLRAHWMEEAAGKLSEKYEFSPRVVIGFTDVANVDGRVRYWHYGRDTRVVSGGSIELEFDVVDVEATHHFAGRRSEVVLGGGLRLATIKLSEQDDDDDDEPEAGCDLLGLTMAADGMTPIFSFEDGRCGWIYGGRLSILAGDWGRDDESDLVEERQRDDNVVVHELYAGLEYARSYRNIDLSARLAFEMQNWHSDVLSDSVDTDSIGFIGPGLRIGAEY